MTEQEQENKLKELLTNEFLAKLTEVARLAGWSWVSDYTEVADFVRNMYKFMDKAVPDTEPYDIEYEDD